MSRETPWWAWVVIVLVTVQIAVSVLMYTKPFNVVSVSSLVQELGTVTSVARIREAQLQQAAQEIQSLRKRVGELEKVKGTK